MDKILILNGGYSEVPLIRAAKAQGFYVIVTGKNEKAVGNALADEYISWDYSDKEGICELARSQKVSAICSGCNDFAYLSAAYACEKLHLPGHDSYETALTLHHKDLYRAFAKRVGIPVPEVIEYSAGVDLARLEILHFPLIIKPVDLFGGMGMRKCHDMEEVKEAVSQALADSRMPRVLIEEFLEGTNHGFTAMIQDRKVVFSMLDKEYHEYSPFAVSAASVPEPVPPKVVSDLEEQIQRMAEKLQLCDGLMHTQFILTEDGRPVIIEVCRRSPGDLYIDFVRYATGVDYPGMIVSCEAGRGLEREDFLCDCPVGIGGYDVSDDSGMAGKVKGFWGRHVIACRRAGKLMNIIIDDRLAPYINQQVIAFEKGHRVAVDEIYKCGVLFLKFQNREEMETVMSHASEYIRYEMEG